MSHSIQETEIINRGKDIFSEQYGQDVSSEEAREIYSRLMEICGILSEMNRESWVKHE
jgi:hypothetical protein